MKTFLLTLIGTLSFYSAAQAAETIYPHQWRVEGNTTYWDFETNGQTHTVARMIFKNTPNGTAYTGVICGPEDKLTKYLLSDSGQGLMLLPESTVLIRAAVGARFVNGETLAIKTDLLKITCTLKK